jgi:ABC-type uncharacterized transport system auxiliary subunit
MKIAEEKLNQIKDLQKQMGQLSMEVAHFEIQKHNALHKISALQNALNAINKELIAEHGENAEINLQTGEVTKQDNKQWQEKSPNMKRVK